MVTASWTEVEINSIKFDSRQVTRGDLFVAITGGNIDGHEFIGDAIEKRRDRGGWYA